MTWIKCDKGSLLNLNTGAVIRVKTTSDSFSIEHLMSPDNVCTIATCDLSEEAVTILTRIAKLVKAKEVCG